MSDYAEHLKEMLKTLEKHKTFIMQEINRLNANENAVFKTSVYPMAKVKPLTINGYPVFQFGYEGLLPLYKEDDYEYLSMIRYYYQRSTFGAYDYSKLNRPIINKAVIIFVQYFKDNVIRDLDNRNKKYIQDAIRQTRIISDDNWKHVWNMDIGFEDKKENHVQVFVVDQKNLSDFYDYLIKNHNSIKGIKPYSESLSDISKDYMLNKEKSKDKNKFLDSIPKEELW